MKELKHYRIFLSGPSDVAAELEIVKLTLDDICVITKSLGFVFDTYHWISDTTPGISTDAQGRINEQASGYDAIIAIFGVRIGSPTKNHRSGTIEEIENAISVSKDSVLGSNSVVVLFKEIEISLKSPDVSSLAAVGEYRDSLSERGVLYKYFRDDSGLREIIFKTVAGLVGEISSLSVASAPSTTDAPLKGGASSAFLAKDTVGEEQIIDPAIPMGVVTAALGELTAVIQNENLKISNSKTRDIQIVLSVDNIADAMSVCAESIAANTPIIEHSADVFLDRAQKIVETEVSGPLTEKYNKGRSELIVTMQETSVTLHSAAGAVATARDIVVSLPRLNKKMNEAKARLLSACQKLEFVYLAYAMNIDNFISMSEHAQRFLPR